VKEWGRVLDSGIVPETRTGTESVNRVGTADVSLKRTSFP
jgi:hypothetical protein